MASLTPATDPKPTARPVKPPTNLHPTSHLDPTAYVQGPHAISLDAYVVVHPRARLVSTHGPVLIGQGSMIHSRAIIGGPVPDATKVGGDAKDGGGVGEDDGDDPVKTVIGENVVIGPGAEIRAGATVGDAAVIESQAVVCKGVTVRKHSKVCAGVTADWDVGDAVVVWGNGQQRRVRSNWREAEKGRLRAVELERVGIMAALKLAAAKAAGMARKKG